MLPRILIDPGDNLPLVEVQKSYDTDLQTKEKTVVGAINEINKRLSSTSSINSTSEEFIVDGNGVLRINTISTDKIDGLNKTLDDLATGEVDVSRLSQNGKDVLILDCND